MAMLSFEIVHESKEASIDEDPGTTEGVTTTPLVAFAAISVRCIREGLRLCKLYDASGNRGENMTASTLLIRTLIEVEEEGAVGSDKVASVDDDA